MPKRDPSHMEAQRVRILRAAFECIAENGVGGTSIAGIRRRAGLSAGALYVHFRSKDEIVAETVRYNSVGALEAAEDWPSLTAAITSFADLRGYDIVTMVRAKHHLNAEMVRSGYLNDLARPLLQRAIDELAGNLRRLHEEGHIGLRFGAEQTALNMHAFIDGMLWIGLAHGRSLEALSREMRDGLDCFVVVEANASAEAPGPADMAGASVTRGIVSHDEGSRRRSGLRRSGKS